MVPHDPPKIISRFKYDSMGRSQHIKSLKFIKSSHQPRDILNVVQQFTNTNNSVQEVHARSFVRMYKHWAGKDRSNVKLGDAGCSGSGEYNDLWITMDVLDAYFFGESLRVDLKMEDDIFAKGHVGHDVRVRAGGTRTSIGLTEYKVDGRVIIYIDSSPKRHPTTKAVLEMLVHELAHAVYRPFTCRCTFCYSANQSSENIGRHGHGKLWVKMAEHMRDTIRNWDKDLANFMDGNDIEWHHMNL